MTLAHRLRSLLALAAPAALSAALLVAPGRTLADQPEDKAPAAKPADRQPAAPDLIKDIDPAAKDAPKAETPAPAAKTATVTPEAKQVIEQVDAAYGKLKSLELAGTFARDEDAAGDVHKESRKFTAAFVAPNKFRHAMEDDMVIGSDGRKAYGYLEGRNLFAVGEVSTEKLDLDKLPEPLPQLLQMQNPSLMFAVARSARAELVESFTDIRKVDDVKLDGLPFQALEAGLPNGMVVTMLFHPETHLLRQARTDIRAFLEQRGTPDVKRAVYTVDYNTTKPDVAVKEDQFAWAPPQAARDVAEVKTAQVALPGDDSPATELEGKAAPDFKLKNIDGKEIALKDLKGKVVVLDVWATWCGPCRVALPHLDKLYVEMKDKGVEFYAVNLQEEKEDVQDFIKTTGLKVPVLLDSDGSVSLAYRAAGIPQTVVIGKDGKVVKVIVGFDPEEAPAELKQAVENAMK